jgi:hypothetical protein
MPAGRFSSTGMTRRLFVTVDSAILEKLHATAAALARAVDRANVRVKAGCREADAAQIVRRCVDLQQTFEVLARTIPAGHPDYHAVVRAREIYRLVVRRVASTAGLAPGQRSAGDGPVKLSSAGRTSLWRGRSEPAHVGRHPRDRRAATHEPGRRPSDRPGALRDRRPGSPRTENTTQGRADAHRELIAMAGQAVRESRLRLDAVDSAARDTRAAARRTAARVEESARILEIVSVALYRAG